MATANGDDLFRKRTAWLGAIVFEAFLYGVYCILFAFCIYTIMKKRRGIHWIFQVFGLVQFLVASTDIVYAIWLMFAKLLREDVAFTYLIPRFWLYFTSTILADTLLIYRCYIVWGRDKRILTPAAILLVATVVCGFVFGSLSSTSLFPQSWVFILLTAVLNISLTSLTASRIWWIARRARKSGLRHRYNVPVMILIESGCIYCLYMILDFSVLSHGTGTAVLDAGLAQMVGIMPTLILAQVGLGCSAQDLEAKSSSGTTPETVDFQTSMPQFVSSIPFSTKDLANTILDISPTRSRHLDWSSVQHIVENGRYYPDNTHDGQTNNRVFVGIGAT